MDDQPPYTSEDFHDDVQKQFINSALATLADTKLEWSQVVAFLSAGRALCRDDVRLNGRLAVHALEYDGADLVEAEEAYLSLSVRDREDGIEWLQHSWWLSDTVLASGDRARVEGVVAALERSIGKLREWLDAGGDAPAAAVSLAEPDGTAGV